MAAAPPVDVAAPFDLATYIDRYPAGSETRLQRLLFIANKDTEVSAQALQLVERHFRETQNVRGYKQVFGGGDRRTGCIVYDSVWVQDTERLTQSALATLEARLSAAQAQLQKEAIRTAYLAIGDFLRQRGDLPAALRAIMRSREYCTTRAQTAHVCLVIIEMAMNMKNYQQVHDYVAKAAHSTVPGDTTYPLRLKVASGTAFLAEGKFERAANQLISVWAGEDLGLPPEDIALYGTLCGLASLERDQLQTLLDTPGFLDLPHLEALFEGILHRLCMEYLKPYNRVDLTKMASIFGIPTDRLISILADLILGGKIGASRIDCQAQTLERLSDEALLYRRQHATKVKLQAMEQCILNDAYAMMVRVAFMENCSQQDLLSSADQIDDEDMDPMDLVGNPEDAY
ncbi:26S proteasome subunit RPN7 [Fragilaria crotonensis]|nr:26S proteasome subunit RPN7 [Fragilaria crotonensis]